MISKYLVRCGDGALPLETEGAKDGAKLSPPPVLAGVAQQPIDGVSFAPSFAPSVSRGSAPSPHRTRYFEIMGHAGLYQDGWFAASQVTADGRADLTAPWQLYDLRRDFSQTEDLSAREPARLAALRAAFQREAERNHVLPLSSSTLRDLLPQSRPETVSRPGHHIFYSSPYRYSEGTFPSINNRSWTITATLDAPASGGDGVIVTQGGRFSGWGLVVLNRRPAFLYRPDNWDETLFRLDAPDRLAAGRHVVTVGFAQQTPGIGAGGTYTLSIDGRPVARRAMARTVAFKFAPEDAAIGRDTGTPLIDDYRVPFAYGGRIVSVDFDLGDVTAAPPRQASR